MSDQEASGTGNTEAVEAPKNDYVLTGEPEQVKAEPTAEAVQTPKNEPEAEEDEDDTDQEDSKDGSKGRKPKRGGFQRRVAKAEAEATFYRERFQELERQRSGLPVENLPAKADFAKVDPSDPKPSPETFQGSLADFNQAQFDWNVRQFDKAQKQKETENRTKADLATKGAQYEASKAKAKEKFSDFDQVLSEYDSIKVNPAITRTLLDNAENGPEFAYWLAKNPEEFEKLNKPSSTIADVYRTYGRFEALQGTQETKAAVKTTNAPPPIKPVNSSTKPSSGKFYEGMPYEDYKKLPKSERG